MKQMRKRGREAEREQNNRDGTGAYWDRLLHTADTLITILYVIITQLPCNGRFQFLQQCPSRAAQIKSLVWTNRRQSQIALGVASLLVNEAIFLERVPLRGN